MEKNRFRSLAVALALVLGLTAATGAYAAPAEALPEGGAVIENAGGNACTAAAALADTPEAQMRLIVLQPVPNYCTDCIPCTHKRQCGIDSYSGIYMGECWLAPSYCPGSSGTVCVCR